MEGKTKKTNMKTITMLLRNVFSHVETNSAKSNIKIPKTRLTYLEKTLSRYLSEKLPNGRWESLDRRFSVGLHNMIYFQSRNREIKMPLHKLAACLSLTKSQLFHYLTAANKRIAPFSIAEKFLIKNIIRLAKIRKTEIPCVKIRNL